MTLQDRAARFYASKAYWVVVTIGVAFAVTCGWLAVHS